MSPAMEKIDEEAIKPHAVVVEEKKVEIDTNVNLKQIMSDYSNLAKLSAANA